MIKTKFTVIKIKSFILPLLLCMFMFYLVIFSNTSITSSKAGLSLWASSIVPSLFPFFVATELLSHTCVISILGKMLNPIMKPLFNVPGEGAFAFIMGIISGYPVGAKIVSNFYESGICTKEESERLLAFTNNSGPLYIIGSVGASMFGDSRTGILLFVTHILSCITVGVFFRFWKSKKSAILKNNKYMVVAHNKINLANLGEILSSAIVSSIRSILLIGGFVVLFSVLISILNQSQIFSIIFDAVTPVLNFFHIDSKFSYSIITGIIELTNGLKSISTIPVKAISQSVILSSFLLGFGGICIMLQVFSITSKAHISIRPYIIGKVLQGTFAALYTFLLLHISLFFNLDF